MNIKNINQRDCVTLVDRLDKVIGTHEKLSAHQMGLLHRAFSIFIFNSKDQLLIQRRAPEKYHTGGLWSNTCCSHPSGNKPITNEASNRLQEEMGLSCDLRFAFKFIYKAHIDNNLIEHELDHIFVGRSDQEPNINPNEADAWQYINEDMLKLKLEINPYSFTPWFRIIAPHIWKHYNTLYA